jgi:quercetin dioxygenase-like cupin family protein
VVVTAITGITPATSAHAGDGWSSPASHRPRARPVTLLAVTPEVGLELVDPVAGTRVLLVATAASTDGAYVEVEVTYPPHSVPLPMHVHPHQAERVTVVAGRLHVRLGDAEHDLDVGGVLSVPLGAPHQMHAAADGPTTARFRTTPALHTDQFFCDLWQVASDRSFQPDPLAAFAVVQRYADEFRLCH